MTHRHHHIPATCSESDCSEPVTTQAAFRDEDGLVVVYLCDEHGVEADDDPYFVGRTGA